MSTIATTARTVLLGCAAASAAVTLLAGCSAPAPSPAASPTAGGSPAGATAPATGSASTARASIEVVGLRVTGAERLSGPAVVRPGAEQRTVVSFGPGRSARLRVELVGPSAGAETASAVIVASVSCRTRFGEWNDGSYQRVRVTVAAGATRVWRSSSLRLPATCARQRDQDYDGVFALTVRSEGSPAEQPIALGVRLRLP